MIDSPDGRVALVTGGARGIGAATAAALLGEGYGVATVDVEASDPGDALALVGDVSNAADVERVVHDTVARFGRLDVVVNNAGILDVHAVHDTPEDVWDRVMAVNVKSVYLTCRVAMPHLRRSRQAAIVNVSSVHAQATVPRAAAYAASKGAVLALTRQMALDYYDDGVRVNAVVVGSVDTAMSTAHGAALDRDGVLLAEHTGAIGRMAQPAEVAAAIAFLASTRASFVTGASLTVDGGMLARLL